MAERVTVGVSLEGSREIFREERTGDPCEENDGDGRREERASSEEDSPRGEIPASLFKLSLGGRPCERARKVECADIP